MGGGVAPIVAPMRNQIQTAPRSSGVAALVAAPDSGVTRYRPSGDLLPGGLTPAQWAALTPDQQSQLISRESAAAAREANAAARGVSVESARAERELEQTRIREAAAAFVAAANLARDLFRTQTEADTARMRDAATREAARYGQQQALEMARLQQATDLARINAGGAGAYAPNTYATGPAGGAAAPMPTWQWVAIGALVAGGGYYVMTRGGKR
jgi:hypothetical protein